MRIDLEIPAGLNEYVAGTVGPMILGRQRFKSTLEGLTPDQLTQLPAGSANSIATLVIHVCATEISMAYRLMGQPVPDDLKARYLLDKTGTGTLPVAEGETVESLTEKLEHSRGVLLAAMAKLTAADLGREIEFAGGRQPTVRWVLGLLPGHQAQHMGQIQMIKKLLK